MPTEVGHDVPQLGRADETVPVPVKDLKGLSDLRFTIHAIGLPSHHSQELGKVDGAVSVGINLVDHVLELSLCEVPSQGTLYDPKLLGGDLAISICHRKLGVEHGDPGVAAHHEVFLTFIEQRESLLEL